MPIDPNSVTWDPPPAVPGSGGARTGGVIITDTTKGSAEQRAQNAEGRASEDQQIQKDQNRFSNVDSLRKQYDSQPAVKSYRAALPLYVKGLNTDDTPQGDLSLIYAFAKVMDPDSAVREGEAASVADADTLYGQTVARLKKQLSGSGTFSPEARQGLRTEMQHAIAELNRAYKAQRQRFGADAEAFGLDPDRVIGAHDGGLFRDDIYNYWAGKKEQEGGTGLQVDNATRDPNAPEGFFWANQADDGSGRVLGGVYDETGKPLGAEGGGGFDENGNYLGLFGTVTARGEPPEIDESLLDTITGDARSTEEIESLPDWATMPEMNELSASGMLAGLGTMSSSPEETARIIQQNFPGVRVRQDEKGNYILRSRDGEEYAIKPGFRWSDVPRAAGTILSFTPAGRASTIPGAAAGSALTQAAIEGSQAASGGSFDPEEVLIAGAGGAAGKGLENAVGAGVRGIKSLRSPTQAAPEAIADVVQAADTPAVPLTQTEQTEAGRLARKATGVGPSAQKAREKLAVMAATNGEAREAAERLGMELPLDILSDDAQVKTLTGLARSQIGSEAQGAWGQAVANTVRQADEALEALGATPDIAQVGDDVMARLTQSNEALERQAGKLRKKVDAAVDVRGRVDAANLEAALGGIINDLGGITDAKQAFSAEEKRLLAMLGEGEAANRPTYARLIDMKAQIGEALFKGKGPWADTSQANLAKYYKALSDDQIAHIESVGGEELANTMRESNTLFSKMYEGRRVMQGAFGAKLEKDLTPLINRAVANAQKGDAQALRALLDTVPEDMRGPVLLSGIMKQAQRASAGGGFSFDKFAKLYRGLRENGPIYKQVADAAGPQGAQVLQDLYAISRRMAEGENRIIRTGAANQPLLNALNAESLLSKLLKGTAAQTAGKAASTVTGAVAGGPAGAVAGATLADGLQSALGNAGKSRLDKLHALLSSGDFRNLVEKIGTQGEEGALNRLSSSKDWNNFAAKVLQIKTPADRKAWLRSALTEGAVQSVDWGDGNPPVRGAQ